MNDLTNKLIDEIMTASSYEIEHFRYDEPSPRIITVVVMQMPNGERVISKSVRNDIVEFDKDSEIDICKDEIRRHLNRVKVKDSVLDANHISHSFLFKLIV